MNLNDMSAQYNSMTGSALGFTLKSKKTGKVFQAIAKAVDGKFVIVSSVDAKKMWAVNGNEDRYEFATTETVVDNSGKKAELETKLAELEAKVSEMESTLEDINSQIYDIEDELVALG